MTDAVMMTEAEMVRDPDGGRYHYELPVAFFRLMLGETLAYSSGYYLTAADSLAQAQRQKLEMLCKKLELGPHDHLLEMGAAWGSFALYAAQNYGCQVTGISLSPVQREYVMQQAQSRGIAHLIQYDLMHALDLKYPDQTFSKVISIEATEHIVDLETFYQGLYRVMQNDGLISVQVIAGRSNLGNTAFPSEPEARAFIREYFFPFGEWSPISQTLTAIENAGFELVDLENITDHYYITQKQWLHNLETAYADHAAHTGVNPQRYLAQILFAAGSVDTFARSTNLDYQVLSRKNGPGLRRPLPLNRDGLRLAGPTRPTLPPQALVGQVELEIVAGTTRLAQSDAAWYVDLAKLGDGIQSGHASHPVCTLRITQADVPALLSGELSWPDAFVQGRITYTGDLTAMLWVRDLVRTNFGNTSDGLVYSDGGENRWINPSAIKSQTQ